MTIGVLSYSFTPRLFEAIMTPARVTADVDGAGEVGQELTASPEAAAVAAAAAALGASTSSGMVRTS